MLLNYAEDEPKIAAMIEEAHRTIAEEQAAARELEHVRQRTIDRVCKTFAIPPERLKPPCNRVEPC